MIFFCSLFCHLSSIKYNSMQLITLIGSFSFALQVTVLNAPLFSLQPKKMITEIISEWMHMKNEYPAGIYLFKVNNRNTRTMCEICLKLTIKTTERHHWRRSVVFIVDSEQVNAGWIQSVCLSIYIRDRTQISLWYSANLCELTSIPPEIIRKPLFFWLLQGDKS